MKNPINKNTVDLICGYKKYVLRWALDPNGGQTCNASDSVRRETWGVTRDAQTLAEILAEVLREHVQCGVLIVALELHWNPTPSRRDYVVYWDRDHGGTIQVKTPCDDNADDYSRLLTLPQARAFVLALLNNPDGDVGELLKGLQ